MGTTRTRSHPWARLRGQAGVGCLNVYFVFVTEFLRKVGF
jgi:hypothetical protein